MSSTAKTGSTRPRSLLGLNIAYPSKGEASFWVVRMVILIALALFFGLPMLWLLLAPSKTNFQIASESPLSFNSFGNYWTAFQNLLHYDSGIYATWVVNSFEYVLASVLIGLTLSVLGGYALAAYSFRGRGAVLTVVLIAMIMPNSALVLPLFLEINLFHLLNTPWAVILPSGFFPFGVYLSYTYFTTSLPGAIIWAARVDGASELRIFRSVALPLAKPLVSLVAFFAFVSQWNNFFLVEVMISSTNNYNLQVGLASILSGAFFAGPNSAPGILRPELALAGILLAAPLVILFLLVQRYLLAGLLAGFGTR